MNDVWCDVHCGLNYIMLLNANRFLDRFMDVGSLAWKTNDNEISIFSFR